MLEVDIHHSQGTFTLDAAFTTAEGLTALIGPSGAGKTTLINCLAGLTRPQKGHIRFGGTDWFNSENGIFLPADKRRIGYVFQDGRLFPHLTVRQNLDYARRFNKQSHDAKADNGLIDLLGIGHLMDRRPAGLSGGERSRVAIGRALFSRPQLLIMDEPLSALDAARKAEILPHLEYIRDQTGIPVFYVSHAMEEVLRLANSVVSIAGGQVVGQGDPADILGGRGSSDIEPGTFLQATVREHLEDEGLTVAESRAGMLYLKASSAKPGDLVRVHIPAHDIILGLDEPGNLSTLNRLKGHILSITSQGGSVWVTVNCSGEAILVQVTQRSADLMKLAPGLDVYLLFKSVSIDTQGLFRQQG